MNELIREVHQLSPERKGRLIAKVQDRLRRSPNAEGAAHGAQWSPIMPLQAVTAQPPIFFVHPMGGALFFYLPLLKRLGPFYNAYGIQGHGLFGEQQALSSIPEMALHYINAVRQVQPHGPYQLVGYSMGGVIALEMAQQLKAQGEPIARLALLDAYIYTQRIPFPGREIRDPDERLLRQLLTSLDEDEAAQVQRLLRTIPGNAQRLAHVVELAKQAGSVPQSYTIAQMRRMFDSYEAHMLAIENYRARPYADRVHFFQCEDTSDTDAIPSIPWTKIAQGGVIHYRVAGRHSTMMREPNVQQLAYCLRQCLWRPT